jgi:hypothetical protein
MVGWDGSGALLLSPPQAESIARPRASISKVDRDVFFISLALLEYEFASNT